MIDADYLRPFCTVRQLEVLDAVVAHGTYRKAATALGVAHGTVCEAMSAVKRKAAVAQNDPKQLLPDGMKLKRVSVLTNKEGALTAQWTIGVADEERQKAMFQAAFDAMTESLPRAAPAPAPEETHEALCNLVTFTDYHLGMLAWHKEGGADWDVKIAERLLVQSYIQLIKSAPAAAKCVLNIQGDFLHSDGLLPVTPAHKHVLDQDGRFSKIVASAIRVLRQLIDDALMHHAEVHLIICEGNHDEASSIWLRQMFAALYEQEPRLTVNDSELPFYVHQHGDVMLAFHHGHKVSNEQMPMLFAAQFPRLWGATTKRYCHTGHRHHVDEKEYAGMTVTQHPTLTARDAYAARGGYISERSAASITYHQRFGQVARTMVTPEMFATTE